MLRLCGLPREGIEKFVDILNKEIWRHINLVLKPWETLDSFRNFDFGWRPHSFAAVESTQWWSLGYKSSAFLQLLNESKCQILNKNLLPSLQNSHCLVRSDPQTLTHSLFGGRNSGPLCCSLNSWQDWGPMVAICDYVMEVHRQLLRTEGLRKVSDVSGSCNFGMGHDGTPKTF